MGLSNEGESTWLAAWRTGQVSDACPQLGLCTPLSGGACDQLPALLAPPTGAQGVQQVPATLLLLHPLPARGGTWLAEDLSYAEQHPLLHRDPGT